MPQHLGFRDRLPANFGSENLRESTVMFDDFYPPNPEEEYWSFFRNTGASSAFGIVESLRGGVFHCGPVSTTYLHHAGIRLEAPLDLSAGKNLVMGSRITLDFSLNGTVGSSDFASTGFFWGVTNYDITNNNMLTGGLAPVFNGEQSIGFVRDVDTLEAGRTLEIVTKNQVKGQLVETRLDVDFSAGITSGRFYDFGLAVTSSGVIKFSVDDEEVGDLKPDLQSDLMNVQVMSHQLTNGGSLYPEPFAIDWFYARQDRVKDY